MAGVPEMKRVRTTTGTFKVRPEDLEAFMRRHPDAEVLGEEKPAPKQASRTSKKADEKKADE